MLFLPPHVVPPPHVVQPPQSTREATEVGIRRASPCITFSCHAQASRSGSNNRVSYIDLEVVPRGTTPPVEMYQVKKEDMGTKVVVW